MNKYISETKEFECMNAHDKAMAIITDAVNDDMAIESWDDSFEKLFPDNKHIQELSQKVVVEDFESNDELLELCKQIVEESAKAGVAIYKVLKFFFRARSAFNKLPITKMEFVERYVLPVVFPDMMAEQEHPTEEDDFYGPEEVEPENAVIPDEEVVDKKDKTTESKTVEVKAAKQIPVPALPGPINNKNNGKRRNRQISKAVETRQAKAAKSINGFSANKFIGNSKSINDGNGFSILPLWPDSMPGATKQQKADYIKQHITYIKGKHNNVNELQLVALCNIINSEWLRGLMASVGSKCNPSFPVMKEIDFCDSQLFDMALEIETIQGPDIVILFGSMPYTNPNGLYGNNIKVTKK